jgi:hypothetical protein
MIYKYQFRVFKRRCFTMSHYRMFFITKDDWTRKVKTPTKLPTDGVKESKRLA